MDEATRRTALSYAHRCYEEELELLRTLARIPAPSRHEGRRGRFVRDWLRAAGAGDAHIDEVGNVICGIGTKDHDEVAVFCAHTDVVFPDTEELPLTEEDGVMPWSPPTATCPPQKSSTFSTTRRSRSTARTSPCHSALA